MNGRVITFGEVMMRLSCIDQGRFMQAKGFEILYAGSEATVASVLSLWGVPSAHVTAFPDNDLGLAAAASLKQYGVDTSYLLFKNGRLGLFFLEHGASLRAPRIVYDRFDSAFAKMEPKDLNWKEIFRDASWFHWSGITPAISAGAAAACLEAVKYASANGIVVSGDINYRRNLWQYGKTPLEIMPELIRHCDVLVSGITDFENCLGITGRTLEEASNNAAERYPNIKKVITTERTTLHASHHKLSGWLWNAGKVTTTKEFELVPIVDRVGAGDAFMAGFIYASLTHPEDDAYQINFATASGAMKHTIEGDVNIATVREIDELISGHNVGKLLR